MSPHGSDQGSPLDGGQGSGSDAGNSTGQAGARGAPLQAVAIMERGLAETGAALISGDFDSFAAWFAFPYTVISARDTVVCTTREDLRALFDRARDHYARQNVAKLLRIVREAAFTAPDHVRCTYETNLVCRRNLLVGAPHLCLTDLRLSEDGQWRVVRGEYDLPSEAARAAVLVGKPG